MDVGKEREQDAEALPAYAPNLHNGRNDDQGPSIDSFSGCRNTYSALFEHHQARIDHAPPQ